MIPDHFKDIHYESILWFILDPKLILNPDPNFVIRVMIYEIVLRSNVLHIELHKHNDVVVGMQTRKFIWCKRNEKLVSL